MPSQGNPNNRMWAAAEVTQLLTLHRSGCTSPRMALRLNRTPSAVRSYLKRYYKLHESERPVRNGVRGQAFTPEQRVIILSNYGLMPTTTIALAVGRAPRAVSDFVYRYERNRRRL